jgi:drug/metabolite transporter (DMT)-like permease
MMASDPRATIAGIACVLGAVTAFSINDVAIKFLSGGYALHQIVLIRSVIGLGLMIGVFMPLAGGTAALRMRRLHLHLARALMIVLTNTLFFLAIAVMPLGEGVAIFFVAPLIITALSVVFLAEKVGPRRWFAVLAGLAGVVIVMRPGTDAMQPAALLVLGSALAYAGGNILVRRLGGTESALAMTVSVQLTFIVVGALMGLAFGDGAFAQGEGVLAFLLRPWVWPDAGDALILLASGVASATGAFLMAQAYRLCDAALAAPFEYASLPLAVLWGAFIFGERPDLVAWAGMALILGSGLYVAFRELQIDRARRRG